MSEEARIRALRDLFAAHGWEVSDRSMASEEARFRKIALGEPLRYYSRRGVHVPHGVWLKHSSFILMVCTETEAHQRIAMIDMLRSTWRDA